MAHDRCVKKFGHGFPCHVRSFRAFTREEGLQDCDSAPFWFCLFSQFPRHGTFPVIGYSGFGQPEGYGVRQPFCFGHFVQNHKLPSAQ